MTKSPLMLAALAAFLPVAASAQDGPSLNLEQKTMVRCSAAMALAANLQESGDQSFADVPDLRARGMEYFVRAMASLMDQTALGREAVTALLEAQAAELAQGDALAKAMPPCLVSLEASGL